MYVPWYVFCKSRVSVDVVYLAPVPSRNDEQTKGGKAAFYVDRIRIRQGVHSMDTGGP